MANSAVDSGGRAVTKTAHSPRWVWIPVPVSYPCHKRLCQAGGRQDGVGGKEEVGGEEEGREEVKRRGERGSGRD